MNTFRFLGFLFVAAVVFAACKKEHKEQEVTRRDQLLGTWSRVLRAYDRNGNHILDSSDIYYAPATDTFIFSLAPDATYQRILTFKSDQFPVYGTWHLQNNDDDLVTQPTTSSIHTDTFRVDSIVSETYLRYHTINSDTWYWEAFRRPR